MAALLCTAALHQSLHSADASDGAAADTASTSGAASDGSKVKGKKAKGGAPAFAVGKGTEVLRRYVESACCSAREADGSSAAPIDSGKENGAAASRGGPNLNTMLQSVADAQRASHTGGLLAELQCALSHSLDIQLHQCLLSTKDLQASDCASQQYSSS